MIRLGCAGLATLFYSLRPDGQLDPFSLHAGCPPTTENGTKWVVNKWFWTQPWVPQEEGDHFDHFLRKCPHVAFGPLLCAGRQRPQHAFQAVAARHGQQRNNVAASQLFLLVSRLTVSAVVPSCRRYYTVQVQHGKSQCGHPNQSPQYGVERPARP